MRRNGTGNDSPNSGSGTPRLGDGMSLGNMSALLAATERHGSISGRSEDGNPTMVSPPGRGSSRRNRMDDLEDMMMMEAIRLSLAAEEERKKKEDKEAKKMAKKKEKETKKAEKAARKGGLYPVGANDSASGFESPASTVAGGIESGGSSMFGDSLGVETKGKSIDRTGSDAAESSIRAVPPEETSPSTGLLQPASTETGTTSPQRRLEQSRAPLNLSESLQPSSSPLRPEQMKPSHLRQVSNTSSSASSFLESGAASLRNGVTGSSSSFDQSPNASGLSISHNGGAQDTLRSSTPPGGGAGLEPMFNFRSLAAMIGDEEKDGETAHIEHEAGNAGPVQEDGEEENRNSLYADDDDALGGSIATVREVV